MSASVLAKNALAILAGRGLSAVLGAASFVLLVRALGSERVGQYGVVYAYVGLFGWLPSFGLEQILPRQAALDRAQAGRIFGRGTTLALLLAVLAALGSSLAFPHLGYDPALRWLVALAAVEVLLVAALRLPALVFQVDQRQWHVESVSVARQLLWLALLSLLLLLPGTGLADVVVARLVCAGFEAAALLALARRHVGLEWGLSRSETAAMLSRSWPVALSSLAVFVYHRIDQVMLGLMVPMAEIGRYVAAVNISEQFSMLALAFVNPLTPLVARAAGDPDAFARYQRLSFRYLMTLAVGISVAVAPSAGALLQLLFGGEFRAAHGLLAVLIWSEVAVFFGLACNLFLIASHRERVLPVGTLVGALANFGLNLALIPRLGALGAAWATLVSYSLAGGLVFLLLPAARSVPLAGLRELGPVLASGLMAVGTASLLPAPGPARAAVAVAAYLAALAATGRLRGEDLRRLRAALPAPQPSAPGPRSSDSQPS